LRVFWLFERMTDHATICLAPPPTALICEADLPNRPANRVSQPFQNLNLPKPGPDIFRILWFSGCRPAVSKPDNHIPKGGPIQWGAFSVAFREPNEINGLRGFSR
jgi:hypothetical protein